MGPKYMDSEFEDFGRGINEAQISGLKEKWNKPLTKQKAERASGNYEQEDKRCQVPDATSKDQESDVERGTDGQGGH